MIQNMGSLKPPNFLQFFPHFGGGKSVKNPQLQDLFQSPSFIDILVCTGCKETKDEFEDPDEETRKVYVSKLFTGIIDWNFGLFLQELFRNEYKVEKFSWAFNLLSVCYLQKKEELLELLFRNFEEDLMSIDVPTFREALKQNKAISKELADDISSEVFSNGMIKAIDRNVLKQKLFFMDIDIAQQNKLNVSNKASSNCVKGKIHI